MTHVSLHELQCLIAVVEEGSFQAAAKRLHRTHPSVHSAVRNLEEQLGVHLLDRSGYRVGLTTEGRALLRRARRVLAEVELLTRDAAQFALGEEAQLDIVIGDLTPMRPMLETLKGFFASCPYTRLNVHFEAIAGPWERLLKGEADLILHHVEPTELRIESAPLLSIKLLPVVGPRFLPFPISPDLDAEQMSKLTQCVIRDTASPSWPKRDYFIIPDAPRCTVPDQYMKRELILGGMAWGHLPIFLVEDDLQAGRLLSLAGNNFQERSIEIRVCRRARGVHGPVARRLWEYLVEAGASNGWRTVPDQNTIDDPCR